MSANTRRLRELIGHFNDGKASALVIASELPAALDEIDRLRAEVERLKKSDDEHASERLREFYEYKNRRNAQHAAYELQHRATIAPKVTRLSDEEVDDLHSDNMLRVGDGYATAHEVAMLTTELRERRALDLSSEDRASLEDASAFFVIALTQAQAAGSRKGAESAARILALIDRLLTAARSE